MDNSRAREPEEQCIGSVSQGIEQVETAGGEDRRGHRTYFA